MILQELKNKYAAITDNIAQRRLKPAFDLTGILISENSLGMYADEYRSLQETYHYMLKYTMEGFRDPERQKIYRKLIVSLFELADKVFEAIRLKYSPEAVYERKRTFRDRYIASLAAYTADLEDFYLRDDSLIPGDDETSLAAAREHQEKMRRLFYNLWFTDNLTPADGEVLRNFIVSPVVPVHYKSFIVTGLMLSLQRFFDAGKFGLLFDAYNNGEIEVNQRALVALLINLYKYDERIPFYPDITGRLKLLNESGEFIDNVERIIVQFIRSKDTEKLQQRIRDEILPDMIKISPNLKDKINLDSLMGEGTAEDKNPDWEEIFRDAPGLMNKMEEFSELQMEGADVFMGSFSMLKSFPFYNEMSNWFMPFFSWNPEVAGVLDVNDTVNRKMMDAISNAPVLCNSDKYSFCFSIQSLPRENREFLAQGIDAEMSQMKEMEQDDAMVDPGKRKEFISNQYIQDLYRFYKLFPRRSDFEDPFNWRFDFHNKAALGEILQEEPKVLRNIAEYYFAKNHYWEAAELFGRLAEQEQAGELYQKVAYCHQKLGDYEKALGGYLKADLYDINRLWNLKKIALCYRNLKQAGKALEYYREAEKLDSDSLNNQLNIGHCLLELDRFEEALKVYFKVEYLAPGNRKVWRPIAWCSFLSGKKEQAEKYLRMIIEDEPTRHDFMNMGHVQWSLGNRQEALDCYRKSISEQGFSEAAFLEVFGEDLPHLLAQGIDSEDVPFMLDQLRYFVEG